MLIYKIESLIDGRMFIGQTTTSLEKRIKAYKGDISKYKRGKYTARSKIIRALAKYGFENFHVFVIDKASSQEELDSKERFWISIYNSTIQGIGFNIQLGGFGAGKHSEETKKIMSDKKKGQPAHNKGKIGYLSGEQVGNAKLSQFQADQIRLEYKAGKSAIVLAKIYNVCRRTISNIINNKSYKNNLIGKIIKPWFVYLIKSDKDGSIYTGITLNVLARLKTHNEGRGARYTRGRGPFIILYSFEVETKSQALIFEYKIKQLSKKNKLLYFSNKLYCVNNKETIKIKNDVNFILKKKILSLIRKKIKKAGVSVVQGLSYSVTDLRIHIESQFESWMNWNNQGVYNKTTWDDNDKSTWVWQLDHIIPHSTFNYSSMEDQSFKECWALSNLRPYSAKQNLIRWNK